MNWQKRLLISSLTFGLSACGVKGDPLPPERPAELGRGRPTYKRATERIMIKKKSPVDGREEGEDEF